MKERATLKAFKMPRAVSIAGRTSTITNSFVDGIIPVVEPSDKEVEDALRVLGMIPDGQGLLGRVLEGPYPSGRGDEAL